MQFLKPLAIALTLTLTSTAALADNKPTAVAFKPAPRDRVVTLETQRVGPRSGTATFDVQRGTRRADLALMSSDPRVDIRRVVIHYAGGKRLVLRGDRSGRMLDLPDGGRIASLEVSYVNKGVRGATIKLVAKDARPQRPGFQPGVQRR
jgi:hypothetical protein